MQKRSARYLAGLLVLILLPVTGLAAQGRVAVLDLVAKGVNSATASNLTDLLATEVARVSDKTVVAGQELRSVFKQKKELMLMGRCNEGDCLEKLSSYLDTSEVISGSVGVIGELRLVNLQRLDQSSMQVLGRASVQTRGGTSALANAIREAVLQLYGLGATIRLWNQVDGALLSVNGKPYGMTPVDRVMVPSAGEIVLLADKPGYVPWQHTVAVTEGASATVRMELQSLESLNAAAARRRVAGFTLLGTGAGLGAGALATWLVAAGKADTYNALDSRRTTPEEFARQRDKIDQLTWTSVGLAGGAGVVALTGVVLLVKNPAAKTLASWESASGWRLDWGSGLAALQPAFTVTRRF